MRSGAWFFPVVVLAGVLHGQAVPQPQHPASRPPRVSLYLSASSSLTVPELVDLIPAPPAAGSAAEQSELATLHQLERTRTAAQIAAAQRDDHSENIFAYSTLLGPGFNKVDLPITAQLGAHMVNEAALLSDELKRYFARPRPYRTDPSLKPVCDLTTIITSYPSGHSLVGYLEGFALAEVLQARHEAILERADDFAHNRMVCGVHYESDTRASRTIALAWFGAILATPKLQAELAAARQELQAKLPAATEEPR